MPGGFFFAFLSVIPPKAGIHTRVSEKFSLIPIPLNRIVVITRKPKARKVSSRTLRSRVWRSRPMRLPQSLRSFAMTTFGATVGARTAGESELEHCHHEEAEGRRGDLEVRNFLGISPNSRTGIKTALNKHQPGQPIHSQRDQGKSNSFQAQFPGA